MYTLLELDLFTFSYKATCTWFCDLLVLGLFPRPGPNRWRAKWSPDPNERQRLQKNQTHISCQAGRGLFVAHELSPLKPWTVRLCPHKPSHKLPRALPLLDNTSSDPDVGYTNSWARTLGVYPINWGSSWGLFFLRSTLIEWVLVVILPCVLPIFIEWPFTDLMLVFTVNNCALLSVLYVKITLIHGTCKYKFSLLFTLSLSRTYLLTTSLTDPTSSI